MKLSPVFLALLLGALPSVRAAAPNFEFTGLISADGKTRFALTEKSTDVTDWVELGADFKGYSVAQFDAKEERVVLKKDGREYPLQLTSPKSPARLRAAAPAIEPSAPARVAPAPATPAPPGSPPSATQPSTIPPPATQPSTTPPPAAVSVPSTPAAPPTVAAEPAALPPAVREPQSPTYVIQGGDSWEKISVSSGVSVDDLQRLNPVIKGSSLPAGQTIRIK